ncbi:MAG TPA: hypothetical protein VEB60_03240 [Candidatus Paceibacterota bacterium]|nr:hypothetical protein [Candidatus Paceibacterota bacterium]
MNIEALKQKLEQEEKKLVSELNDLGRQDPDNPEHWEVTAPEGEADNDFNDEIADRLEDMENGDAVRTTLEQRLGEVGSALERITNNTYGTCEAGDHPIEEDRLEANPAARTCKAHMEAPGEQETI